MYKKQGIGNPYSNSSMGNPLGTYIGEAGAMGAYAFGGPENAVALRDSTGSDPLSREALARLSLDCAIALVGAKKTIYASRAKMPADNFQVNYAQFRNAATGSPRVATGSGPGTFSAAFPVLAGNASFALPIYIKLTASDLERRPDSDFTVNITGTSSNSQPVNFTRSYTMFAEGAPTTILVLVPVIETATELSSVLLSGTFTVTLSGLPAGVQIYISALTSQDLRLNELEVQWLKFSGGAAPISTHR